MERTILIIDDNPQIIQQLSALFKKNGFAVVSAKSEMEADSALSNFPITAIISEIFLPTFNGFNFYKNIKKHSKQNPIPFIFYSELPFDELPFLDTTIDTYIQKTLPLPESNQTVVNYLKKIQSNKTNIQKPAGQHHNELTFKSYYQSLVQVCIKLHRETSALLKTLEKHQKRYDFLTDSIGCGYWEWNPQTNAFFIDPYLNKLLGFSDSENRSTMDNLKSLIHPDDLELFNQNIKQLLKQENDKIQFEVRLLNKQDQFNWLQFKAIIQKLDDNHFEKIRGTFHDISTEKQFYQNFLVSKKLEGIGRLAIGIAHDFNNVLTTILGNLELISIETTQEAPWGEELSEIQSAAKRATWLSRQLLLYSRNQPLQPVLIDLNQITTNMHQLLRRVIGEDIRLVLQLNEGLKSIKIDQGQIEQLIMNLVINLISLISDGGQIIIETQNISFNKSFHSLQPGDYVGLFLKSTGTTFFLEAQSTSPQPTKVRIPGFELIKQIIMQNNGYFVKEVKSKNEFNLFIYFPVAHQKEVAVQPKTTPLEKLHGSGERILFIEDEKAIRDFVQKSLKEYDYQILGASDAHSALSIFQTEKKNFDLILSDIVLPDQSGLELVNNLLKQKANIPVLLTSGYTSQKTNWSLIQKQGFYFLPKPYTLPELLQAIKEALHSNH